MIFVFRHGLTSMCNVEKTPNQVRDVHMTSEGVKQVHQSVSNISNIDVIFCSNTLRTIETAEIIANKFNSEILCDARLNNKDNYIENTYKFIKEVSTTYKNKNVCIVTHGRIIKLIRYIMENDFVPMSNEIKQLPGCEYGNYIALKHKEYMVNTFHTSSLIRST